MRRRGGRRAFPRLRGLYFQCVRFFVTQRRGWGRCGGCRGIRLLGVSFEKGGRRARPDGHAIGVRVCFFPCVQLVVRYCSSLGTGDRAYLAVVL
jgi:hypothetical protein